VANATMTKFGYPGTLIREYDHWVVLLRPQQVTLGSLVLAANSEATAFSALPAGAFAELAQVTTDIEHMLGQATRFEKINYLMLMMVDPHVHFHIFPRYEGDRSFESLTIADTGWPGPPDLRSGQKLEQQLFERLRLTLL
jgi:diadenosine tetraphosphate (Ap4A) HIT family hydrolase